MMIEFECGNYSGFDAATGRYVICGHRLVVPSEKIGDTVICPKCKQKVEVPIEPRRDQKATSKAPSGKARQSKTNPSRKSPRNSEAAARKKSSEHSVAGSSPSRQSPEADMKLSGTIRRPSSDLSDLDFEESKTEKRRLAKESRKRCSQCGALIKEKQRCKSCGHLEQSFEKINKPLSEIQVELAGFQLWFVETMSEGLPFHVLTYLSHGMFGFLALFLMGVALVGVGGTTGAVMFVLVGLAAALYVALVLKGRQLASDPRATLAWFQKPFWNLVLWLARRANWQGYDERFRGRKIIDCRGEGITDSKILQLEDLGQCQVLDLEDTPITDAGLRHLYGLPNLYCVVLRYTQVTDEGVFRLQQSKPRLWIWY
jgi:uncharacterized membrane protein YuzA (DUF378 family)